MRTKVVIKGLEGVERLRSAARWCGDVREDFWTGWRAEDVLALYLGWQTHELDEYPDQASAKDVRTALKRGRALLRAAGRSPS